jgi:hypothetical protein
LVGFVQGSARCADFFGVPAAPFAHVLDRLIDAGAGTCSTPATAGILTAPLLGQPQAWPYAATVFRAAPAPPRRRRRLTATQRRALDTLRRNGAWLDDDFLKSELKSAFRELARGLHPDMHPHASDEERQWLSAAFRETRDAYEALASQVGQPTHGARD